MTNDELTIKAQALLRANDRGGYAVPSSKLYPFQWNWDAAINAVGWQTFDEPRAWEEIHSLLKGQWPSGLVPHIVFHREAPTYFPGPSEWGCQHINPPTTSISQPPVLATMVHKMWHATKDKTQALEELRRIVPKLVAHHAWWFRERDIENTGLVVSYHPWESGNDNSPAWDAPLAAVPPTQRSYTRRDTSLVDSSQRPHQSEYDRFVYLMDFFREAGFDAQRIYDTCPYRVVDFSLNAILLRANADLAELCEVVGLTDDAVRATHWFAKGQAALMSLWSDELGRFVSLDTRTQRQLSAHTHASYLAWYAKLWPKGADDPRAQACLDSLKALLRATPRGLVSTAPTEPGFDANRYWRGPAWPHINWLVLEGLNHYGHTELASQLSQSTLDMIKTGGLFEYFNPLSGQGMGGPEFSWTAAIALILLK